MSKDNYVRELVQEDDRILIQSVCVACGFRIIGSALQRLEDDESEHRQRCGSGRLLALGSAA